MKHKRSMEYCWKNEENFATLYELTLHVCGIPKFPDGTFTRGGDGWWELAEAWENLLEDGAAGVFFEAAHHIMWGIHCNQCNPEYMAIVRIIEEELLKDGDAFAAWDQHIACDTAIVIVGSDNQPCVENDDSYCYSLNHYQYLRAKMLWKIRFSKKKYKSENSEIRNLISTYEETIGKILPAAGSWDEAFWYDENHIYDALVSLYGVDYRNDFLEYDRVLLMIMETLVDGDTYGVDEAWFAGNINRLPMSLAKVIWPTNTKEKIVQMFLLAAEAANCCSEDISLYEARKTQEFHSIGFFEYRALYESWLYKTVEQWEKQKEPLPEAQEVKRSLFTVAMRQ